MKLLSKEREVYPEETIDTLYIEGLNCAEGIEELFLGLKREEYCLVDAICIYEGDHAWQRPSVLCCNFADLMETLNKSELTEINRVSFEGIHNGEEVVGTILPEPRCLILQYLHKGDGPAAEALSPEPGKGHFWD